MLNDTMSDRRPSIPQKSVAMKSAKSTKRAKSSRRSTAKKPRAESLKKAIEEDNEVNV